MLTTIEPASLKNNPFTQHDSNLGRKGQERLGLCFVSILTWIVFEYGRPANPLMFPMIISAILFLNWLVLPGKKWNPQIVCFLLLLGEMLITVPLAGNTYSAFWTTYNMAIVLVFICIPLIHFVDSLRKVTILLNAYLFVFLYVGIVAVLNGGMGPAREFGGQDENYTAALMCMAIPVAAFSIYFIKGASRKILLIGLLAVYVTAVIVGFSRGGFVGLVVALLYCLLKSPKKWVAVSIGGVGIIAVLFLASAEYWQDMGTITATTEGTADLRIEAWKIAFRMFQAYPIFGVGPGNFVWHAAAYQSPEQFEKFDRGLFLLSHSTYFDLLSELGLIGVGLFVTMLYYNYKDVTFMTKHLQRWKQNLGREVRGTVEEQQSFFDDCQRISCSAYGLMGATVGLLAAFSFLSGLYYSNFWVLTAMIVALKEVSIARLEQYQNLPTVHDQEASLRTAI